MYLSSRRRPWLALQLHEARYRHACPTASLLSDTLSVHFLVSTDYCNWFSFQYVLSFVFQDCPFPTFCSQYVLSFVPFVAFAKLRNIKSRRNSRGGRPGKSFINAYLGPPGTASRGVPTLRQPHGTRYAMPFAHKVRSSAGQPGSRTGTIHHPCIIGYQLFSVKGKINDVVLASCAPPKPIN